MTITKSDFMNHAKKMEDPCVITCDDSRYPYINTCFSLEDKANPIRNTVQLIWCRLSEQEYQNENIESCVGRIKKHELKYNRWLKEMKAAR